MPKKKIKKETKPKKRKITNCPNCGVPGGRRVDHKCLGISKKNPVLAKDIIPPKPKDLDVKVEENVNIGEAINKNDSSITTINTDKAITAVRVVLAQHNIKSFLIGLSSPNPTDKNRTLLTSHLNDIKISEAYGLSVNLLFSTLKNEVDIIAKKLADLNTNQVDRAKFSEAQVKIGALYETLQQLLTPKAPKG